MHGSPLSVKQAIVCCLYLFFSCSLTVSAVFAKEDFSDAVIQKAKLWSEVYLLFEYSDRTGVLAAVPASRMEAHFYEAAQFAEEGAKPIAKIPFTSEVQSMCFKRSETGGEFVFLCSSEHQSSLFFVRDDVLSIQNEKERINGQLDLNEPGMQILTSSLANVESDPFVYAFRDHASEQTKIVVVDVKTRSIESVKSMFRGYFHVSPSGRDAILSLDGDYTPISLDSKMNASLFPSRVYSNRYFDSRYKLYHDEIQDPLEELIIDRSATKVGIRERGGTTVTSLEGNLVGAIEGSPLFMHICLVGSDEQRTDPKFYEGMANILNTFKGLPAPRNFELTPFITAFRFFDRNSRGFVGRPALILSPKLYFSPDYDRLSAPRITDLNPTRRDFRAYVNQKTRDLYLISPSSYVSMKISDLVDESRFSLVGVRLNSRHSATVDTKIEVPFEPYPSDARVTIASGPEKMEIKGNVLSWLPTFQDMGMTTATLEITSGSTKVTRSVVFDTRLPNVQFPAIARMSYMTPDKRHILVMCEDVLFALIDVSRLKLVGTWMPPQLNSTNLDPIFTSKHVVIQVSEKAHILDLESFTELVSENMDTRTLISVEGNSIVFRDKYSFQRKVFTESELMARVSRSEIPDGGSNGIEGEKKLPPANDFNAKKLPLLLATQQIDGYDGFQRVSYSTAKDYTPAFVYRDLHCIAAIKKDIRTKLTLYRKEISDPRSGEKTRSICMKSPQKDFVIQRYESGGFDGFFVLDDESVAVVTHNRVYKIPAQTLYDNERPEIPSSDFAGTTEFRFVPQQDTYTLQPGNVTVLTHKVVNGSSPKFGLSTDMAGVSLNANTGTVTIDNRIAMERATHDVIAMIRKYVDSKTIDSNLIQRLRQSDRCKEFLYLTGRPCTGYPIAYNLLLQAYTQNAETCFQRYLILIDVPEDSILREFENWPIRESIKYSKWFNSNEPKNAPQFKAEDVIGTLEIRNELDRNILLKKLEKLEKQIGR